MTPWRWVRFWWLIERARRQERRGCRSDLSCCPQTVADRGPLRCEVTGKHEVHQRWTSPAAARWVDLPGGGRRVEHLDIQR